MSKFIKIGKPFNFGSQWAFLGQPVTQKKTLLGGHQNELFGIATTKNMLTTIIGLFGQVSGKKYSSIVSHEPKSAILVIFGPFLGPQSAPFGVLTEKYMGDTNSLMGIYLHAKNQNKTMGCSPDIFSRSYPQISGILCV